MSLIKQTIELAIKNLGMVGCQYKVVMPDGTVVSNIQETQKRSRVIKVPMGTYSNVYGPVLKSMQEGEFAVVDVPNELSIEDFRSSMAAWASTNWGRSQLQTQVVGRQVHCLRGNRA